MSSFQPEQGPLVRPYAVTGGRVRAANSDLPLEALVEMIPGTAPQGRPDASANGAARGSSPA